MPSPELILWQVIRNENLGVKFRRQFSINNFILDFYSPSLKLAIEIDGDTHYENSESRREDVIRDHELAKLGIRVLRFTNRDIMENLDGVVSKIIEAFTPSQSPPIQRTGGEVKVGTLLVSPSRGGE